MSLVVIVIADEASSINISLYEGGIILIGNEVAMLRIKLYTSEET